MSVLLEQDKNRALQSHLDELTWRTTLLFSAVVILTLAWSYFVDDVLDGLLTMLKPCAGDCLNVYDPAQWSAVRWLTALCWVSFRPCRCCSFTLTGLPNLAYCHQNIRPLGAGLLLHPYFSLHPRCCFSPRACQRCTPLDLSNIKRLVWPPSTVPSTCCW